jgi:hypothetical protein
VDDKNRDHDGWESASGKRQRCCSLKVEQGGITGRRSETVGFWIHDAVRLRVRLGKIHRRLVHYGCNANAIPRWHFEEYNPPGVRKSIR